MFEKKDIIFSETMGVCRITDITKLTRNQGNVYEYYVLKSVFNKEKVSYIPVENHSVVLRELITLEEAKKIKESTYNDESELKKQEVDYVIDNYKK